jgi:predicted ATPase
MAEPAGVIRTPDQRLRVFVSSTLRELAAERRVVRDVIERMALAPVMFELGARPHPPRSLYRAYLDQSDIFIGMYWESYGWVAPGEEISGLEDEYRLAPEIPLLIYVKNSDYRQERLGQLLDRIRSEDRASYVAFDEAADLDGLVTSDLATLLAESFDEARRDRMVQLESLEGPSLTAAAAPPPALNRLIGRTDDLQRCVDLLGVGGCRIVTLTGPGGIGKTRLAIAAARELRDAFPDGVAFVDLAPIRDPTLLVPTIAATLGIRDVGDLPLAQKVTTALAGRRMLLVLDNIEQVVAAAGEISTLVRTTGISVLATSRILLHIDGEQAVTLAPIETSAALELFVERARSVRPDFQLDDENREYVLAIAAAVDNLPLALELAATRVRVLQPSEIAGRLDRILPLLTGGSRDHPDRQRTLRATIEWSAELLSEAQRALLLRLAVFRAGFELDAVEWMSEDLPEDGVELLTALVDSSLVQVQDPTSRSSFSMLATVREFGLQELGQHGERDRLRQRHAEFYSDLAVRAEPQLVSSNQDPWIARLQTEFEDIRAAVDHYLRNEDGDAVVAIIWPLYWFWWVSGRTLEIGGWIEALRNPRMKLSPRSKLITEFYSAAALVWVTPDPSAMPEYERLLDEFVAQQDTFGEMFTRSSIALLSLMLLPPQFETADKHLQRAQEIASELDSKFLTSMALLLRGRVAVARGDTPTARELFTQALANAESGGDKVTQAAALNELGWVRILEHDPVGARTQFVHAFNISTAVQHAEGIAYGLESFFALAAMSGDIQRAGRLLGAAEDIRARRGITGPTVFSYHQHVLAQLEASPAFEPFNAARQDGSEAELATMVEEALSDPRPIPEAGMTTVSASPW